MNHIGLTTPFGRRSLSAAQIAAQTATDRAQPGQAAHKWRVFADLCAGREKIGVGDRALAVLNALLSFHAETALCGDDRPIVYPSNAKLSLRAHGMAPTTLRRHLAALVEAGLIIRRDSPNGKRYARHRSGQVSEAFGFELTPLVARAGEFAQAAAEARAAALALRLAREKVTLLRRDLAKTVAAGAEQGAPPPAGCDDWLSAAQRLADGIFSPTRKDSAPELEALATRLAGLLRDYAKPLIAFIDRQNMDGNESQNGRHTKDSNPYFYESEPDLREGQGEPSRQPAKAAPSPSNPPPDELQPPGDRGGAATLQPRGQAVAIGSARSSPRPAKPPVTVKDVGPEATRAGRLAGHWPLAVVLRACPAIADYAPSGLRNYRDLIDAAGLVRQILGVSSSAWEEAVSALGEADAAVCIAAILEKGSAIASPGGYLRRLTEKAGQNAFSIGPMVMALMKANLAATKGRAA